MTFSEVDETEVDETTRIRYDPLLASVKLVGLGKSELQEFSRELQEIRSKLS